MFPSELEKRLLKEIQERWDKENADYFTQYGWPLLALPMEKQDAAIHYDRNFPQTITPLLARLVALYPGRGKQIIDEVFSKIQRYKTTKVDGDHHSPSYGEEVFTGYRIETDEAFAAAREMLELDT